MSFAQEMKDFVTAFKTGTQIGDEKSANDLRKLQGELTKEKTESEKHDRAIADKKLDLLGQNLRAKLAGKKSKSDGPSDEDLAPYYGGVPKTGGGVEDPDDDEDVYKTSGATPKYAAGGAVEPLHGGVRGVAVDDIPTDRSTAATSFGFAAGGVVEAGDKPTGPSPYSEPVPGPNDNRPKPGNMGQGMQSAVQLNRQYDAYTPKPLKMGPPDPKNQDYDHLKDKYTDQLQNATRKVHDRSREIWMRQREQMRNWLDNRRQNNQPMGPAPTGAVDPASPAIPPYMGGNEGNNTGNGFAKGGKVEDQDTGSPMPDTEELREIVAMGMDQLEDDVKANPALGEAYLTGQSDEIPTERDIAEIDDAIGLGPAQMAEGGPVQKPAPVEDWEKNELRLAAMVRYYMAKGDSTKARKVAKSLILYHQQQSQRYAAKALVALQNGDSEMAAKYASQASGQVLNGKLQIMKPLADGSYEYQTIDPATKKVIEQGKASPQEVAKTLESSMAGTLQLNSLMQFAAGRPNALGNGGPRPPTQPSKRAVDPSGFSAQQRFNEDKALLRKDANNSFSNTSEARGPVVPVRASAIDTGEGKIGTNVTTDGKRSEAIPMRALDVYGRPSTAKGEMLPDKKGELTIPKTYDTSAYGSGLRSEAQDVRRALDLETRRTAQYAVGEEQYRKQKDRTKPDDWAVSSEGGRDAEYEKMITQVAELAKKAPNGDVDVKAIASLQPHQRVEIKRQMDALLAKNPDMRPDDAARFAIAVNTGARPEMNREGQYQLGHLRAFAPEWMMRDADRNRTVLQQDIPRKTMEEERKLEAEQRKPDLLDTGPGGAYRGNVVDDGTYTKGTGELGRPLPSYWGE